MLKNILITLFFYSSIYIYNFSKNIQQINFTFKYHLLYLNINSNKRKVNNMLSTAMNNAIRNELKILCENSTNVYTTKYELFINARKATDEWVGYTQHKSEINNIINSFCESNGYSVSTRKVKHECGHIVTEYFITTEEVSCESIKGTRNRIYIPAHIVRAAGFKPGEKCSVWKPTIYCDVYDIARYKNMKYFINDYTWITNVTVEKNGCIRFTLNNDLVCIPECTAVAGKISVEPKY